MDELKVEFRDSGAVVVSHAATKTEWLFNIAADQSGRRHLDGPHGSAEAMSHGDLLRRACSFAQSEALHSGRVDY